MPLEFEHLTSRIIGAAINVHKELGPGFLESIYENALAVELRAQEIPFQRQLAVPVLYREIEVGLHKLDLFVFGEIVVELKAIRRLENIHYVVVVGFEDKRVWINDPARRKRKALKRSTFEKRWNSADRWMLLDRPKPRTGPRRRGSLSPQTRMGAIVMARAR